MSTRQEGGGRAPALLLRPMPVLTGGTDEEGRLVVADGRLVAVLAQLTDQTHGSMAGSWFLEAGFGPCATVSPPLFDTLDAAEDWVARQLANGHDGPARGRHP